MTEVYTMLLTGLDLISQMSYLNSVELKLNFFTTASISINGVATSLDVVKCLLDIKPYTEHNSFGYSKVKVNLNSNNYK